MPETNTKPNQRIAVDPELITMALRMSPEERILTNDNSIRAILDLRNAFEKNETSSSRSQRSAKRTQ